MTDVPAESPILHDDMTLVSEELAQATEQTYDLFISYQMNGQSQYEQEVYARLRKRVLFLARVGLGQWLRQRETSEDIAQESMIQLHKSLATANFESPRKFAAYLASVVQHVITSKARHHRVDVRDPKFQDPLQRSRSALSTTEFRIELEAQGQSPIDRLLSMDATSEFMAAMEECLERLPEDQRDIMVQLLLNDLSYSEAAEKLGKRVGPALYQLYKRARVNLAVMLVARGFGGDDER